MSQTLRAVPAEANRPLGAAEAPAPAVAQPVAQPGARPAGAKRPPTGRALLGRMQKDARLRAIYLRGLPWEAECALEAFARLQAQSPDGWVRGVDEVGVAVAQLVADEAGRPWRAGEAGRILQRAIELGVLLQADDGGLCLAEPAVPGSSPRKRAANAANARFSPGPRPPGISDEEWAERKRRRREEREALERAQGHMRLPIPGGAGSLGKPTARVESQTEPTGEPTAEATASAGDGESGGSGQGAAGFAVASGGNDSRESAAVVDSEYLEESGYNPTTAAAPVHAGAPARSHGEPTAAAARSQPEPTARSHAEPNGEPNGKPTGEPRAAAPAPSAEAVRLARRIAQDCALPPQAARSAPGEVERLAGMGYSYRQIEAAIEEKAGTVRANSVAYFLPVLRKLFPAAEQPASGAALRGGAPSGGDAGQALPEQEPDPRIRANPRWLEQPLDVRISLRRALDKLAAHDAGSVSAKQLRQALAVMRTYARQAYDLLAADRPDVRGLFPGEHSGDRSGAGAGPED